MSPDDLIVPGVVIAALTTFVALLKLGLVELPSSRKSRDKDDAQTEATRVATADQLLQMVRYEMERVNARMQVRDERIRDLEDRVDRLTVERAALHDELAEMRRRMATASTLPSDLIDFLAIMHQWVEDGAEPPVPAIPEPLADIIPPWSCDQG